MRNLQTLPEELIGCIGAKLDNADMFAFRLTCRRLEEKLLHTFALSNFTWKCVSFTTNSLGALLQISRSRLARYIKTVYIMASLFSEQRLDCRCPCVAVFKGRDDYRAAYTRYMEDQMDLCRTGHDKKFLTEIFASLFALRSIVLVDSVAVLPANTGYIGRRAALLETGMLTYSQELRQ